MVIMETPSFAASITALANGIRNVVKFRSRNTWPPASMMSRTRAGPCSRVELAAHLEHSNDVVERFHEFQRLFRAN